MKFINWCIRAYDIILNILFVFLLLFTAFVICYYTLPEQTSSAIAKALSYVNNAEMSAVFMNYLNGFTLGAGWPLWFSQKAMVSRYMNNAQNTYGMKSTQELLADVLKQNEITIEFQKAEAIRFGNSPTMPAKARLSYQKFLSKLDERENIVNELKENFGIAKLEKPIKEVVAKVKKKAKVKVEKISSGIDSLV